MTRDGKTLRQLADDFKQRFPVHLKEVVIFGSQAREEASRESDYDCLLVFDRVTPLMKTELDQLAGQYLLQRGMVLSCIPLSESDLQRLRFEPFLINARREGISL
ncbi:MAG: nucleotidyltransferase domain-containing protein [Candidatus Omnitrophota bacterium]|nr:nucleotidyltransferase domain-containing protein [Candidatus Omnitrophota bacterium]